MYNGFINEYNTYTNPSEINLGEVFYNGAGFDNQITDEEIVEYEKIREFHETDMRKVTTEQIKTLYLNCTGEELTDINNRLNDWVYLEKYDAYYMEAGDTNYQEISCESGYVKTDGVTYVLNLSNGCITTIKVNPESYGFEFIFISNIVE